jgi:glycosyltransferase involved in cell wall biosynthesis
VKIVHLADSMEVGGAETLIALLCRWQRDNGHDPVVYCLYDLGVLGEELRDDGFEVIVHSRRGRTGRAGSIFGEFRSAKPDVVHCHNAAAAIVGAGAARLAGVRSVIVTRHGNVGPPYLLRQELKFALASRCCDWIVAVCDQARANLMAAPLASRQKIVRIYNAVRPPQRNCASLPAKTGLTLLHVGRLAPAKDQETLLKAFAIARTKIPDLYLWIVGEGSLRPKLEGTAREIGLNGSVKFLGQQADVTPFFEAADLFVLSSVTEGIPISLLEALAVGVPAVVTEVGGMPEVARLSGAMTTVTPSDPAALAAAIIKMAQARENLPQLATIARQSYEANFTLERMASEYMALYSGASPLRSQTAA